MAISHRISLIWRQPIDERYRNGRSCTDQNDTDEEEQLKHAREAPQHTHQSEHAEVRDECVRSESSQRRRVDTDRGWTTALGWKMKKCYEDS